MKKTLLVFMTALLMGSGLYAQCPTNPFNMFSQAEVDQFAIDYPNCTTMNGNIGVLGIGVTNLMPLSNLTSVGGLFISNTSLTSLDGLQNLTTVDSLWITINFSLSTLNGLDNLNSINGDLLIYNNLSLTTFSSLNNLTTINGEAQFILNNSLTTFNGLNNLTTIGEGLKIESNGSLTTLSGLDNLASVGSYISIRYNDDLTTLNGLDNLNSLGHDLVITDNNSLTTFSSLNNLTTISGKCFIYNNSSLTMFNGLNNLTTIYRNFDIGSNGSLTTLSGLDNLSSIVVGGLFITGNNSLTSLSGLGSISSIGGGLSIAGNNSLTSLSGLGNPGNLTQVLSIINNSSLSSCNSPWLCNIINDPIVTIFGNASGCSTQMEVDNSCNPPLMAVCKDAAVNLDANGQAIIQPADVDNNSVGATSSTVNPSTFGCSDLGPNNVTLTLTDPGGNTSQCTSTVTVSTGAGLPGGGGGWQGGAVGQAPTQPVLNFNACSSGSNTPAGQFTIGGSGNNATSMTTDNVTFAYQTLCGTNSSITVKVETVSMNGYGGLMMRESSMAGAKQVAVFSDLTNSLRLEKRVVDNAPKQVQNFIKPNPIWLRLKRMGSFVFAEYSSNGVAFSPIQAVNVPMQNCVQVGMATFTYIPGLQATATFSNVMTTGSAPPVPIAIEEGPAQEAKLTEESLFLSDEHTENVVLLFPNPARTHINLQFEQPTATSTRITILNQLGQRSSTFMLPKGVEQEVLDVQGLAAGMYVLRVENDQLNETIPFVITQ